MALFDDLVPGNEPSTGPAPTGGMFGDLIPQDQGGDFTRGAKVAFGQTVPLLKGVVGLGGATLEQATGEGGIATAVKNWGLKGYQEGMDKLQPLQKDTDELTTAWSKAKEGNLGALVDWVQYGLGYAVGQGGEALATSLIGGVIGGAASGGIAAAPGALAGLVGKGAVKEAAQTLIQRAVIKEANMIFAQSAGKITSEEAVKQATKSVAKNIGSSGALLAYSTGQELGSIYPEAEAEALKRGEKLTGMDLARVWGSGLAAGGIEALTDKLGIDVAMGKLKVPGSSTRLGSAALTGGASALTEGATEAVQTGIERVGAGQEVFSPEGIKDIINSAGQGAVGGAGIGGGAGLLHGGRRGNPEAIARSNQAMDDIAAAPDADAAIAAFNNTHIPVEIPNQFDAAGAMARMQSAQAVAAPEMLPSDQISPAAVVESAISGSEAPTEPAGPAETASPAAEPTGIDRLQAGVPESFQERLQVVRDQLSDSRVQQRVRDNGGAEALHDANFMASKADDVTQPGATSDAMLAHAERILKDSGVEPLKTQVLADAKARGSAEKRAAVQAKEAEKAAQVKADAAPAPSVSPTKEASTPVGEAAAVAAPTGKTIDEAAHAAAPSPNNDLAEPTEAQAKAGNYAHGHVRVAGLDISVENPEGSTRSGTDSDGKAWTSTIKSAHYGYIRGTVGMDKEHVDAFVKPGTATDHAGTVFVVDQIDPKTGKADEHKALIGFDTIEEARAAYQANYAKDWQGLKHISATPMAEFKQWLATGDTTKPFHQPTLPGFEPGDTIAKFGPRGLKGNAWMLREKATGEAVMETSDPAKVRALNTEKYEAIPIGQHLADLNKPETKAAQWARSAQKPSEPTPPAKSLKERADAMKKRSTKPAESGNVANSQVVSTVTTQKEVSSAKPAESVGAASQAGEELVDASKRPDVGVDRPSSTSAKTVAEPAAPESAVANSVPAVSAEPPVAKKQDVPSSANVTAKPADVAATDILSKRGTPFSTMGAALRALGEAGGEATHEIKRVEGGLVVREKPKAEPKPAASTGTVGAVTTMIEEGDFRAATDYAEAKGVSLDELKLSKADRAKLDEWQQANPPAEETTTRAGSGVVGQVTNPDNAINPLPETIYTSVDSGAKAATWLQENAADPEHRAMAEKLAPFLTKGVSVQWLKAGDKAPATVARRLAGTAAAVTELKSDGTFAIYMHTGKAINETLLLHELIHAATMRALEGTGNVLLRAEMQNTLAAIRNSLTEAEYTSAIDMVSREEAAFFQRVLTDEDELLAYAFSSPTLRKWMGNMNAQGKFTKFERAPNYLREKAEQNEAAIDTPTLWQRFLDAISGLLGFEKSYQKQYEQMMADADARVEATVEANRDDGLFDQLDQYLNRAMDAQAKMDGAADVRTAAAVNTEDSKFRKWFGDSKVVDEQGAPLVVYHGTTADFNAFDTTRQGAKNGVMFSNGTYLTPDPKYASSVGAGSTEGANVMPVYASLKNPLVLDSYETAHKLTRAEWKKVESDGQHDGVIIRDQGKISEVIAFKPTQIKSAIGNSGEFDPANPDIRAGSVKAGVTEVVRTLRTMDQQQARNLFVDAITKGGHVNLWQRTIGTQYAKAEANPTTFKPVFEAVQNYLKDNTVFANAAADRAPDILPKLDRTSDLWKDGLLEHGAKREDIDAAGQAAFDGTLNWTRDASGQLVNIDKVTAKAESMDAEAKARELFKGGFVTEAQLKSWQALPIASYEGAVRNRYEDSFLKPGVVFSDAELAERFKATPKQIGLYKQFRAAIDQSLDDIGRSELLRLAGNTVSPQAAQQAQAADTMAQAAAILSADLDAQGNSDAGTALRNDINEKANQVQALKDKGYAPLMRFGEHTVTVAPKNGEEDPQFFGMYETNTQANMAARALRQQFGDAAVTQGVMSKEGFKLFQGVDLNSLELFADATGNADNAVYQDYLRLAKNNRSAMKRMIHRKGISGFNTNTSRVLASFVTSNARMASGNLHMGKALQAAEAIPKELGDLKDEAVRLVSYVQSPKEEAVALRGLLFTNFIGGSIASAAVNLTQPFTMTLPYLSQFGGIANASKHLLAAARAAGGGKINDEIANAIHDNHDIVSPQEIHHLQAAAQDRLADHPMLKKAAFIWGSMFSLSEQFNRRVTFIAAYQTAKEHGMENPVEFARKAVIETQGLYNAGNKANWARGAIGATLFTFKQFSIHYLEFLNRMWKSGPEGKKAVGAALAIMVLTAGVGGLPFADDLDDLIDTLAQAMGYDISSKKAKREFIAKHLGSTASDFFTRGLSGISGMPIDVSLRMGMGNLLPGTGALLRSNTDRSKDVLEFAGAAGGLAKSAMDAGAAALKGDFAKAGMSMAPLAIQNMAKAAEMFNTGNYKDTRGRNVTSVDAADAAAKFIGFQPGQVARESSRQQEVQRSIQLAKNVEGEIAGKWAQGLAENRPELVREARADLADWNAKNETSQMRIGMQQIVNRVREMRSTRNERTIKAAPREMRQGVREALN